MMRDEYDFSQMKGRKNPYAERLKQQITIQLEEETLDYFKKLANETGFTYQHLIDLYLRNCAQVGFKDPLKRSK
jgi:predicted DNA binding CopG/RHH family protein